MSERAQFVNGPRIEGEPLSYRCAACGETFPAPEGRSFKDAMAELLAAFEGHVLTTHAEDRKKWRSGFSTSTSGEEHGNCALAIRRSESSTQGDTEHE